MTHSSNRALASVISYIITTSYPVSAQTSPEQERRCIDPVTNENRCAVKRPSIQSTQKLKQNSKNHNSAQSASTERNPTFLRVGLNSAEVITVGNKTFTIIANSLEKNKSCNITIRAVPSGESKMFTFNVADGTNIKIGDLEGLFVLTDAEFGCQFTLY